jgi:hypothetical protein
VQTTVPDTISGRTTVDVVERSSTAIVSATEVISAIGESPMGTGNPLIADGSGQAYAGRYTIGP